MTDHYDLGKRLYPDAMDADGYWSGPCGYEPIVRECGRVLLERSDSDYQGDTFAVVERDGRFGFLGFAWGSCSGCDALQACDSYDAVGELADRMIDGVVWEPSLRDLLAWLDRAEERNDVWAAPWMDAEDRQASTFHKFREELRAMTEAA